MDFVSCQERDLGVTRVSCAVVCSLREGGNFTTSKTFIMALRSRRPDNLGTGLVDLPLAACVRMSERFSPPQRLYSHH